MENNTLKKSKYRIGKKRINEDRNTAFLLKENESDSKNNIGYCEHNNDKPFCGRH